MATIGLDKLYYAKITEDASGNETYGDPQPLAKAMTAELSVELAEATLYADDGAAEVVKEFKSGKLSLGINDIGAAVAGDLVGAVIDDNGVVILTSRPDWRFKATRKLSPQEQQDIFAILPYPTRDPQPLKLDLSAWLVQTQKIDETGWSVNILAPRTLIDRPVRTALAIGGATLLVVMLLIGLMKGASHTALSWGDWFLGMLPLSILLVLIVPWLAYLLYPPVLKSGDQVPRWADTELKAMGPLCAREKKMLVLMVGALVLWIFGGDYIDAAMVGYSVVALMLVLRIISWDDIVSNKAAWNVFFWLASLITLATGLNNTGFITWFGKLLANGLSGYSPMMVMVALIVVFYLLRYFFASATAYTSALAPMMIAAALAMPEIPLPVFCLMVGAAIGLGSILTPYATGPSPIYYGSGYLPTVDYWRLGAIFGLIFLVLLVITGLIWMPLVLL